ncbi:hypothetical protein GCM10010518_52230 [Kitasatospora cinereorecta]
MPKRVKVASESLPPTEEGRQRSPGEGGPRVFLSRSNSGGAARSTRELIAMSEENWVGLVVALSLVGYLVAVVMRPGKF